MGKGIIELLAFAAIAKVNPMVALYTSFCMAVVMTTLVDQHGAGFVNALGILISYSAPPLNF